MSMAHFSAQSLNVDISKFLAPLAKREDVQEKVASLALMQMIEVGLCADITLLAQGGSVRAHRAYLASVSPTFHAMMNHETFKENLTSTIDLSHMTLDALQLFLLLLYIVPDDKAAMPEFQAAVDEHFVEICDACQMYQVTRLIPTLNAALPRNLTPENCWDFASVCLAMRCFCERLPRSGRRYVSLFFTWGDYILDNGEEVMQGSRIVEEMRRNPEIVKAGFDGIATELLKYDLPKNPNGSVVSWRSVRSLEDVRMVVEGTRTDLKAGWGGKLRRR